MRPSRVPPSRPSFPPRSRGARRPPLAVSQFAVSPLAVSLLALGVLGGCASDEARLVAVVPTVGEMAPYAVEIRRGAELALELVNEGGGVAGGSEILEMDVVETGASAAEQRDAVEAAIEGGALAVIGPVGDEAYLLARPLAEGSSRAIVSPLAAAETTGIGTASLFRVSPTASLEMNRLVKLLRKDLFIKDVVVFSARSDAARAYRAAFQDSFERLRGNVQSAVSFDPGLGQDDARALVADAELQTKPGDAVVVFADGSDAPEIFRAIDEIDYVGEVFTSSRFHHQKFREEAGEAAQDVMYVAPDWDVTAPRAKEFVEAYESRHGAPPSLWAALGHDAVVAVADALDELGGVYAGDLPITLRSGQFSSQGVLGRNEFDGSGDVVARDLEVYGIRDGEALPWDAYERFWTERNPAASGS